MTSSRHSLQCDVRYKIFKKKKNRNSPRAVLDDLVAPLAPLSHAQQGKRKQAEEEEVAEGEPAGKGRLSAPVIKR